jgi:hypothetical protein
VGIPRVDRPGQSKGRYAMDGAEEDTIRWVRELSSYVSLPIWVCSSSRSQLFDYLDRDGGFYYERWGDASVHSLAAAMLLEPQEQLHFSDLGYIHDGLQYCSFQSTPEEKKRGFAIPPGISGKGTGKIEGREGVGCRCKCDPKVRVVEPFCLIFIGLSMT